MCPFRSLSLAMLVMLWRPKNWSNKTPLLQVASSQNDNNVTIFRNIDGDNLTARKIKEQLPSVQIHGREDGLHVKHFYLNVAPIVLVRITAVYDMCFHRWEFIIQHACNLSRKKRVQDLIELGCWVFARDVSGAILFYPKGKKWPWPDILWRTELNFLASTVYPFFIQSTWRLVMWAKTIHCLKGLNCVIFSISRRSCKKSEIS